jgi:hypothetical protein
MRIARKNFARYGQPAYLPDLLAILRDEKYASRFFGVRNLFLYQLDTVTCGKIFLLSPKSISLYEIEGDAKSDLS